MKQIMMSVLGKDQAGIISKVTQTLFKHEGNLEDVSMTILEGEFAMILIAGIKAQNLKKAETELRRNLEKNKLTLVWKEMKRKLRRGEKHAKGTTPYILTASGRDRGGIVYSISQCLAKSKLNITDLHSRILGSGKKAVYIMMLEVDIPKQYPMAAIPHHLALNRLHGFEADLYFKFSSQLRQ